MKSLVLLSLLAMNTSVKLHYRDCIRFNDDFYGQQYGLVVEKLDENHYKVYVSLELPFFTLAPDSVEVVEKKYCENENPT